MTSVFQGLSLSRSVGRVGENPGNEVVTYIAYQWPNPKHSFAFMNKMPLGYVNHDNKGIALCPPLTLYSSLSLPS